MMGILKRKRIGYLLLLFAILYPLSIHGLTDVLSGLRCTASLPEQDLRLHDYFLAIDPIAEDQIDRTDCRISKMPPAEACIFVKKGPPKADSWVDIISHGTHDHNAVVSARRVSVYSFKPVIPIFLLNESFLI